MIVLVKTPNKDEFIVYDGKKLMNIYFSIENKRAFFKFELLDDISDEKMMEIINLFNNKMIRTYKVISMSIHRKDLLIYENCFRNSLYYEKGNFLQRKVESYRYVIDDSAFDREGYIINQGLIEEVPSGKFKTSKTGCGWIACYNLFKLMNKEKTIKEVSSAISDIAIFKGMFGVDVFGLYKYLRKNNVNAYFTPIFKNQCIRDIKNSKYGIILYIHNRGSHYVAYKNLGNGKCIYYNAVYGRNNHVMEIEDFYKKFSITPLGMLISV